MKTDTTAGLETIVKNAAQHRTMLCQAALADLLHCREIRSKHTPVPLFFFFSEQCMFPCDDLLWIFRDYPDCVCLRALEGSPERRKAAWPEKSTEEQPKSLETLKETRENQPMNNREVKKH